MRNILNYLTIFYGCLLIIAGIMKLSGGLKSYEMGTPENSILIHTSTSGFYILVFNLLGGIAFIFHSVKTMKGKPKPPVNENEQAPEDIAVADNNSRPILLSGIIVFLVSVWFVIETVTGFSFFENGLNGYGVAFVMLLFAFVPFALVPLLLALRNITRVLNE
jgi:hypothetical protein